MDAGFQQFKEVTNITLPLVTCGRVFQFGKEVIASGDHSYTATRMSHAGDRLGLYLCLLCSLASDGKLSCIYPFPSHGTGGGLVFQGPSNIRHVEDVEFLSEVKEFAPKAQVRVFSFDMQHLGNDVPIKVGQLQLKKQIISKFSKQKGCFDRCRS